MFTGIIEETGAIARIENRGAKRFFTIDCKLVNRQLKIGDSVACNGACLTVIRFDDRSITLEAMQETLLKTTAIGWKQGAPINLERAMQAGGRFDGHIVQGHVDGVSRVLATRTEGDTLYLEVELPQDSQKLIVPQGSVALNGVSLTVARLSTHSLTVALIGHTLQSTNLRSLKTGDSINVEYDVLGKYIARYFERKSTGITEEWLLEKGF